MKRLKPSYASRTFQKFAKGRRRVRFVQCNIWEKVWWLGLKQPTTHGLKVPSTSHLFSLINKAVCIALESAKLVWKTWLLVLVNGESSISHSRILLESKPLTITILWAREIMSEQMKYKVQIRSKVFNTPWGSKDTFLTRIATSFNSRFCGTTVRPKIRTEVCCRDRKVVNHLF